MESTTEVVLTILVVLLVCAQVFTELRFQRMQKQIDQAFNRINYPSSHSRTRSQSARNSH